MPQNFHFSLSLWKPFFCLHEPDSSFPERHILYRSIALKRQDRLEQRFGYFRSIRAKHFGTFIYSNVFLHGRKSLFQATDFLVAQKSVFVCCLESIFRVILEKKCGINIRLVLRLGTQLNSFTEVNFSNGFLFGSTSEHFQLSIQIYNSFNAREKIYMKLN